MNKMMFLLKLFYKMIPKFIREQFFSDLIPMIKELKIIKNGLRRSSSFKLISSVDELGCEYNIIFTEINRSNFINSPRLFIDDKSYTKPTLEGNVPDINIYKLNKVSVVGGTDALVYMNKFLHNELNFMDDFHDLKREDIFNKLDNRNYELNITSKNRYSLLKKEKKYISLLKEHSINYYHFMIEGIPRLIKVLDEIEFNKNDYALLLDDGMPKQCIEAIELILGNNSIEIIFIKKGEIIYCEELIYCTPLWISLDNTKGLPNPKKEFFVDKFAVNLVREKLLSKYTKVENKKDIKKVYLQRLNNKLRPISNINKLELCLIKNDFDFIDVGSLSLIEQIELFQTADIIVGVSGAAFTNLIFMKENSIAINFYPSVSATNYYSFQPLADVANIELIHFLTIPDKKQISIHSEASVDIEALNILLEALNGKL